MYYFAYGSNINPQVLVNQRLVQYKNAYVCKLEGYAITFNVKGIPFLEPSFANITPDLKSHVWGVLYEIDESEWFKVRSTEGGTYKERVVNIIVRRNAIEAVTLIDETAPILERKPSKRYISIILSGARVNNFPMIYIHKLEMIGNHHIPVISDIFNVLLNHLVRPIVFSLNRRFRKNKIY